MRPGTDPMADELSNNPVAGGAPDCLDRRTDVSDVGPRLSSVNAPRQRRPCDLK